MPNTLDEGLYRNFFEHKFMDPWREDYKEKPMLELIVSPVCNTACDYCYYKNFSEELYPLTAACGKDNILKNTRKIVNWIKKNNLKIDELEIFSGEFTNLPYFEDILRMILGETKLSLVIPTNCTFVLDEKKLQKVEKIFEDYPNRIFMSLSIDGKYASDDEVRPLRNGNRYPEDFYEKVFDFGFRHNCKFHPMISNKSIKNQIPNFLWFVENIMKYYKCDTPAEALRKIYLLEVRNPDWTDDQIQDLKKFIRFIVNYCWDVCGRDQKAFASIFIRNHVLNIFHPFAGRTTRGLGCSVQRCLSIRLSDMNIPVCHRTSYDGYRVSCLNIDDDGDYSIEFDGDHNPILGITCYDIEMRNSNSCVDCEIAELCTGPCFGSNFEVTGDFFKVPEDVCNLEKSKIYTLGQALEEKGILSYLYSNVEFNSKIINNQQLCLIFEKFIKAFNKDRVYGV